MVHFDPRRVPSNQEANTAPSALVDNPSPKVTPGFGSVERVLRHGQIGVISQQLQVGKYPNRIARLTRRIMVVVFQVKLSKSGK
jgi:hypothetical protein